MKIRTIRYIIKEGVINTYRNKLMTLASVGIVTAALFVFGSFLLLTLIINQNMERLKQQPELQAFCDYDMDESAIKRVGEEISKIDGIESWELVTPKQAFENFKALFGENAYVLEGYDESLLSASYIIALKDGVVAEVEIKKLEQIPGVRNVDYSAETINLISKIANWVNVISSILIIVFLTISVFIIANTIKLTVFSRRKEINIMKFIGATDWFIRLPFIVEGIVIGVIGALIAFLITSYGYSTIEGKLNQDLSELIIFIKIKDIGLQMMVFYALIGSIVGAIGSFVSIRKYLKV